MSVITESCHFAVSGGEEAGVGWGLCGGTSGFRVFLLKLSTAGFSELRVYFSIFQMKLRAKGVFYLRREENATRKRGVSVAFKCPDFDA